MLIHLFTGVFWGVYFVIIGSIALIISFTNMRIPLFRLAVGVFLVYVGLFVFFGGHFGMYPSGRAEQWSIMDRRLDKDPSTVLMGQVTADLNQSAEHNVIFGEGIFTIDPPPDGERLTFEFNSVFGSTTIMVPEDVAVRVKASSVFGSVKTPDGQSSSFGEHTYTSPGYTEDGTSIYIEASAVFGSVVVVRR